MLPGPQEETEAPATRGINPLLDFWDLLQSYLPSLLLGLVVVWTGLKGVIGPEVKHEVESAPLALP